MSIQHAITKELGVIPVPCFKTRLKHRNSEASKSYSIVLN